MAKTKISQYDATAGNNTDINSINISEGMLPSNVNNSLRQMMADLKKMDVGTDALTSPQLTSVDINGGTIDGAVIGGNSAAAISGTTLALSGNADLNGTLDVAQTALVTGVLTTTAATVFNGGFAANAGSTITTADNLPQLTLISTDADASKGPVLDLFRNSANPAVNDIMGQIKFIGEDDGGNQVSYARINTEIESPANGNEIGRFNIITLDNLAGSAGEHERLTISGTESVFNEDSADIDFRVESNGNTHMLFVDGGSDHVNIGTDTDYGGRLNIKTGDNTTNLVLVSTDTDATVGPVLDLYRDSSSPADNDVVGNINYKAENSAGEVLTYVRLIGALGDVTDGTEDGEIYVQRLVAGTNSSVLSFTSSETIFNDDSKDLDFRVESNGLTHALAVDAGNDVVQIGTTSTSSDTFARFGGSGSKYSFKMVNAYGGGTAVYAENTNNQGWIYIRFATNNSQVGYISVGTSSTSYVTSSDYRLKENVDYTWDATTRLKQLKPARFNFVVDSDTTVDGFLAHEVSSVVPEAITGEKDAVDADGVAVMQGIDQSKLVPLLVKTIQELEARITALES